LIALRQTFTNDDETEIIPKIESSDSNSITFMGQLLRQFINLCDAKQYIYIEWMHGWYDSSGIEIMGLDLMTKLHKCFGVLGLSGLDKLLSCAVHNRLKVLTI